MKIVIGGDHAGYDLKEKILKKLSADGHEVLHAGSFTPDVVDFPDIARMVCAAITDHTAERGIMICGSGVGAAIACNKTPGIRAAVVHDLYTARQCVEHDNVTVMAIGQDIIGYQAACDLIDIFLHAEFHDTEEFRQRIKKLDDLDQRGAQDG
ncbi:MAG: RpiB/LacA/LacB family sugar-phosphate isomerase [Bacillota bacterium]|nr:RpiB/LacA/LacB family sugar-phosphate isomerase [Bacillota bacterium]